MSAEARLRQLDIILPPPPPPAGVYQPIVVVGHMAYLSGHGPLKDDGETYLTGRLGEDVDLEGGQAAARQTGLALLATLRSQLGSLDKVVRIVKVLGLVNSAPDFTKQPLVINGFSELMAEIFGEDAGVGARSAIGVNVLPGNIPVEIEMIVQVVE